MGETMKVINGLWEPEINLYLGHHSNDAHLMSTFIHELGHALVYETKNSDHGSSWYKTTACLMTVINSIFTDLNIDFGKYSLCARQFGVNLIKSEGLFK